MNSAPVAAQQQIYIDAFPETQTQTNAYINAYWRRFFNQLCIYHLLQQ